MSIKYTECLGKKSINSMIESERVNKQDHNGNNTIINNDKNQVFYIINDCKFYEDKLKELIHEHPNFSYEIETSRVIITVPKDSFLNIENIIGVSYSPEELEDNRVKHSIDFDIFNTNFVKETLEMKRIAFKTISRCYFSI